MPTYVGRHGTYLQRENNINQLAPGTVQANPGVNVGGVACPYKGLRRHSSLGERGDVRRTTACRSASTAGTATASSSEPPTRSATPRTTRATSANVLFNSLRRHRLLGPLELRPPPRVQLLLHLRPAVLPGAELARLARPGWMADLRIDVHAHGHAAVGDPRRRHRRRRRRLRAAVQPGRRSDSANAQSVVLERAAADQNFWFNPTAFAAPASGHVRQRAPQRDLQPGPVSVGHRLLQERHREGHPQRAVPGGDLQLHQPPELQQRPTTDPTSSTFGRVTGKDNIAAGHSVESAVLVLDRYGVRSAGRGIEGSQDRGFRIPSRTFEPEPEQNYEPTNPERRTTNANHPPPQGLRRGSHRLRRRRRHGREGPHRSRRGRRHARSGRDVGPRQGLEDVRVVLRHAAARRRHPVAPVRRVRCRPRRLDARRRAIHASARPELRLVPDPHARRTHEPLGAHLAALRSVRLQAQEPRRPRRRLADRLRRSEAVLRQGRSSGRHLRHDRESAERTGRHLPAAAEAALLRAADQGGVGAPEHSGHPLAAVDPHAAAQRPAAVPLLQPVRARVPDQLELLVARAC